MDGRADLFSLGLVLRELLTLEPPARPADRLPLPRAINAMVQARQAGGRPTREANARVPHALAAIVAKCLAASPAGRYESAADLAADLALYLGRRPLLYARNPSRVEVALNAIRRARVPLAAAAVAVAIAVPCLSLLLESRGAFDIRASSDTLQQLELAVVDEAAHRDAEADRKIARIGGRSDAIDGLKATVRRHPDSVALRLGLAHAYETALWHDEAASEYREVLKRDDSRIAAIAGLASVERLRHNYGEAVKQYGVAIERAEALPPGPERDALPYYRSYRALALMLLADGNFDREKFDLASAVYERALQDLENVVPPRKGGQLDDALLIGREHYSALALFGLGRCELGAARPARAVECLRGPGARRHGEQAPSGRRPRAEGQGRERARRGAQSRRPAGRRSRPLTAEA